jgi:peptide/nickel transport system ATP-binding protein
VTTQIDVLAAIKDAIRDTGVAALYITHDLAVVAQVSDEIMVLRHGKMVEYGSTDQIIEAPREDYTRALVSVRRSSTRKSRRANPSCGSKVTARYSGGFKFDVLKDVSVDVYAGPDAGRGGRKRARASRRSRA